MREVVRTPPALPTTSIDTVSISKIYALQWNDGVYKLHQDGPETYDFVSCDNSRSNVYGASKSGTVKAAIETALRHGDHVFEFDTAQEFFEWALSVVSKR